MNFWWRRRTEKLDEKIVKSTLSARHPGLLGIEKIMMGESSFSPRKCRPRHLPVSCSFARIFFQIKQCTRALTLPSARVYDKGHRFLLFSFWFPLFSWDVPVSLRKLMDVSDAAKWNLAVTSYTTYVNNTVHRGWSDFLFFNTNLPRTQYFSLK